jgi:hypothetical protein
MEVIYCLIIAHKLILGIPWCRMAKPTFDWDLHTLNLSMVNNDIVDGVKTQAGQYPDYLYPYKDIFDSQYQLPDQKYLIFS